MIIIAVAAVVVLKVQLVIALTATVTEVKLFLKENFRNSMLEASLTVAAAIRRKEMGYLEDSPLAAVANPMEGLVSVEAIDYITAVTAFQAKLIGSK